LHEQKKLKRHFQELSTEETTQATTRRITPTDPMLTDLAPTDPVPTDLVPTDPVPTDLVLTWVPLLVSWEEVLE
jgi:hypothetical protein